MSLSEIYKSQVQLLIRCLPAVAQAPCFALKGGTAINLFYQNMPRVSVDIDLVYLPINERKTALSEIRSGMTTIVENIHNMVSPVQVRFHNNKLFVNSGQAQVKVEINSIVRGSLLAPVKSNICDAVQQKYEMFIQVRRLATAELYGSKLCAALDRQHPRDLFDVMLLQAQGTIPDEVRHAFVVYLASSNRPIAELLSPNRKELKDTFSQHFIGMTVQPVHISELEATREKLFTWALRALTENERKFLLSIKQGDPDWDQLPYSGIDQLPAIQWKLHNVRQMSVHTHDVAVARLRELLEI